MREFLQDDPRQVWARHRSTGAPVYIEVGSAEAVRAHAKTEWKCIVPDCNAPITTSGGSRRDHFRHLGNSPHGAGGESQNHLAAKAMLTSWAARRLPPGATVREEQTVKDPTTAMHRIADVMVTWPDQRQTAFEVEYKPYAVAEWTVKNAEYQRQSIACAWLLGHTRIRARVEPQWDTTDGSNAISVPGLGTAIGRSGQHILVVNPLSKFIGTVAGDRNFTRRVQDRAFGEGWLALDHIDDCALDPDRGLITPTMRRIDAAEEIAQRQRLAEERIEAARLAARQDRHRHFQERNATRWAASPLMPLVQARWPGSAPAVLAQDTAHSWWIHASSLHWHTAVFMGCIDHRPVGSTFTVNDCWSALAAHGIRTNDDWRNRFKALVAFLEALDTAGLATIVREPTGRIRHVRVAASIDDLQQIRVEQERRDAETRERREAKQALARLAKAATDQERAARRKERRQRLQADRDRDHDAHRARLARLDEHRDEQQRRWLASDIHKRVMSAFDGAIPKAVTWPGGDHLSAIDASPAHWHAHIYMTHVHDQPAGTEVTPEAARTTLEAANIDTPGEPRDVLAAVDAYLYNLTQRALLSPPHGGHDTYTC